MTAKTEAANDPAAKLAELERVSAAARADEREARDEQSRRQHAVPVAREGVTRAHATGTGVQEAERAFNAAQVAAADGSMAAKIDGLRQRTRAADGEVQRYREQHLAELVEAVRPRAEAVVQAIHDRAAELREALLAYSEVDRAIGELTRGIQWFRLHREMPAAPIVDRLRAELDPGRLQVPVPMPRSTESPAAEQERFQREHAEMVEGSRQRRVTTVS